MRESFMASLGAFRDALLEGALSWASRLLVAAVILLLGMAVKRLLRTGLCRLLSLRLPRLGARGREEEGSPRAREDQRKHRTLEALLLHTYDAVAWFILAVAALSSLGINVASLLTVAGVGGIAVGLGAQTIVKDVFAGVLILLEEQYAVGDTVSLAGLTGEVERMTLRVTELRSFSGDLHVIPNSEIRTVSNHTRSFHRAVVDLSVDYAQPLDRVTRVLEGVLAESFPATPGLTAAPQILGVTDLAADGVNLRVLADCAPGEHWAVERALRRRIKDAFDAEGIALSIPQRMVHMAPEGK
ncbi:mechanosensitive ion channel domain-containing protein [Beduinella massiliensis]|uniref:mechanosensitive ion channel domain-containing protein n=1 Tax=Beduinella massiliensis TaxID=1852363 RepID=UPI000C8662B2